MYFNGKSKIGKNNEIKVDQSKIDIFFVYSIKI